MEYRIDGAVASADLRATARTFSLILRSEGLYVIHTTAATRAVANLEDKQIAQAMSRRETQSEEGGAAFPVRGKHSKLLAPDQILGSKIKEGAHTITLEIHSSQGMYKFRLAKNNKPVAEAIMRELHR